MSHLQVQIANTAIKEMLAANHFSICTIDKVAKMLGLSVGGQAYNMLTALHCIEYGAMPRDVREAIPGLIRDAFQGVRFDEIAVVDAVLRRVGGAA